MTEKTTDIRFGAGPSLVPVEHLKALYETGSTLMGTSHRKKEVKDVVASVRTGLRQYFQFPDDYEVILGNGGATFLFDMIALGLVEKKSAHFVTGEFSNKWYKSHAKVPWIETQIEKVDFGSGVDTKNIDDADMICTTLNETSTGVMNTHIVDVDDHTIMAVDATSGGGQIKCDFSKVDIYFFSPQKVFAADGGLFVAIMSPKAMKRALEIADSDRYFPEIMNWKLAINNSLKDQTYNTPSIANLFLLDQQVQRMNKLGEDEVIRLAKEKSSYIYNWADKHPLLTAFVTDSQYRSDAVATIDVDDKYPIADICEYLQKNNIARDIGGYRKLGRNQLRIGLFHNVTFSDLKILLSHISNYLESN